MNNNHKKTYCQPPPEATAYKARAIAPMSGEKAARGQKLFAPVALLDNHWLLINNGKICGIEKHAPAHFRQIDLGDAIILPAAVNAHTHLQLSWLAGKTQWGAGFTIWLKSMLKFLLPVVASDFQTEERLTAIENACVAIAPFTALAGDIGGSITGALSAVHSASQKHNLSLVHFCEWFGFNTDNNIWPERCRGEVEYIANAAPAAHGLYSTSAQTIQKAHVWCTKHGRVFSIHLAESADETELLCDGSGPLYELYANTVLPPGWQAPKLRPLAYADKLGILTKNTLAVHGAQLNKDEIIRLARSGASLCLCPRSNYNLGAGDAPVLELMERGVLCCLGTDGLTSCHDLNVINDAFFLREKFDLPVETLWRMLTVNGAAALGMAFQPLTPGAPAKFSLWPWEAANV